MYVLSYYEMAAVPESVKVQLRELSFGPDAGGMWAWTFQTSGCYVATLSSLEEGNVLAWTALTSQVDHFPVAGCYTSDMHRGLGLGKVVVNHLFSNLDLPERSAVYAVAANWASWPKLLQRFGLIHFEWE